MSNKTFKKKSQEIFRAHKCADKAVFCGQTDKNKFSAFVGTLSLQLRALRLFHCHHLKAHILVVALEKFLVEISWHEGNFIQRKLWKFLRGDYCGNQKSLKSNPFNFELIFWNGKFTSCLDSLCNIISKIQVLDEKKPIHNFSNILQKAWQRKSNELLTNSITCWIQPIIFHPSSLGQVLELKNKTFIEWTCF